MTKLIKLSELAWFQEGPGVRNYQYTNHGVKLINVSNLGGKFLNLSNTDRYISEQEATTKYNHFLCDDGDLVIATSGISEKSIREKVSFVRNKDLPLCMNTSVVRFKALNKERLNIDFLYYFFKSDYYKEQISRLMTGIAQLNYGPSHLSKIYVNDYSLIEQNKIVDEMNKISNAISFTQKKMRSFDELIKSRFIEMFGDVTVESNNTIKLGSICKTMGGGTPTTKKPEYYKGSIPWISTVSLGPNYIDGSDAKGFITEDAINNSATKLIPAYSIMVGTRVGVGKCSVNTVPICTNQDINSITGLDFQKYVPLFIKYVVDAYQPYFDTIKKGATILGINSNDLKNINVPKASISIQKEFVSFVEQIDKSKLICQKQLDLLNDLFNKKLDEYFGG